MPQMTFTVRWPDGLTREYYSPSLVVHDHLSTGADYSVAELRDRARVALGLASDRVLATYGFRCTSAAETVAAIDTAAARYADTATARVVGMDPDHLPPPDAAPGGTGAGPDRTLGGRRT